MKIFNIKQLYWPICSFFCIIENVMCLFVELWEEHAVAPLNFYVGTQLMLLVSILSTEEAHNVFWKDKLLATSSIFQHAVYQFFKGIIWKSWGFGI
uniref:Secreted protein n=1 Tax=Heterorhabditis bacteriophora TaxID=37862 RepID=A0A1I7WRY9_HETBA